MKIYLTYLGFTALALIGGMFVLTAMGVAIPLTQAFGVFLFVAVIFGIPVFISLRGEVRATRSLDLNSSTVEIPVGYTDYQGLKAAVSDLTPEQSIPETVFHRVIISSDSIKFVHALWAGSSELPTSLLEKVEARDGRLDLILKDSHRIVFDGGFRKGEATEPYAEKIRQLAKLQE